MKKENQIGIVIDSTTVLSEEDIKKYNIQIVSLNLNINEKTIKELDMNDQETMDEINSNKSVTTASPSPFDFRVVYEKLYLDGYRNILVLPLSKELSGTYQSAVMAKTLFKEEVEHDDVLIEVIDTNICNFGLANILETLFPLLDQEASFDEVIKALTKRLENSTLLFTVYSLNHLVKGGRLGKISGIIGSLLKIKPVIKVIDGKLQVVAKYRTSRNVIDRFVEEIDVIASKCKQMSLKIVSLKNDAVLKTLLTYIKGKYRDIKVSIIDKINPVFTIHVGDNGIGIAITGY